MNRKLRNLRGILLGAIAAVFFLMINVEAVQAQATFGVAGSSSVLNSLGVTELLGPVSFFVQAGTTQSGTLEFFVPKVTFTDTSGLTLVGTGGLALATISAVIPGSGDVIINIPPGAAVGSTLTLSGLRISAVGANFTTLNGWVSTYGNSVQAGQNLVQIVRNVLNGVAITNNGGTTLTIANNLIVTSPGTYVVAEGFLGSFSSTVGVAGQTNKTQVVFQITGLPDGISLTFPSPIASDTGTGATLDSGGPQVVTNQSSSNRVIYEFNAASASAYTLEQFSITPTVGITGTVGSGSALIQVAMGPIGIAVPSTQYPSTAIPRYIESFTPSSPVVPPAPTIVSKLAFPVPAGLDNDVLTISNVDTGTASITAIARAIDGSLTSGISNQVTLNVGGKQSTTVSLKDVFGTNALSSGIAAVELTSSNHLVANSIGTIGTNRFGIASPAGASITYLPFDMNSSADIPTLAIENSTASDASAQIVLRTSAGDVAGSAARTVTAHGVMREAFSRLFSSLSVPLSGHISITTTGTLRSVLVNNPGSRPDEVPSLIPVNPTSTFPFYAFGGGYNTVVTLINAAESNVAASITLNAYTVKGSPLLSQPIVQILIPGERFNFDFSALLGTASNANQVNSGYFTLSSQPATFTLFAVAPIVYGMGRLSINSTSTVVPIFNDSGTQVYLTPTSEGTNTYTGIALLNNSAADVSVTLELTSATGTSLGTATVTIPAGNANVQLLRNLIPQSLPHDGGALKISASGNVKVLGFRGTLNLSELILLRGETTAP